MFKWTGTEIFHNIRIEYGSQFELLYTIFFSAYIQIGGLLFGLLFWFASVSGKAQFRSVLTTGN